jgi:hypothetical protein
MHHKYSMHIYSSLRPSIRVMLFFLRIRMDPNFRGIQRGRPLHVPQLPGLSTARNPVFAKGRLVGPVKSLETNDWDWEERMYLGDGN